MYVCMYVQEIDRKSFFENCFHLCPEMQAVVKMEDLMKFSQTDNFYANYITRDGANMFANLTIFAIFM